SKCNVTIKRGTKVIAEIGPIQSLTNDQCRHEQNKMFDDICMELAGEAAQSSSPVTVHGRWRNELGDISLGSGFEPRQCLADGTHKCPAGYFKDSKGRCVSLI
ncbi:MAG: hypothetical protein KDD25_02660, partial [Bdellovibrionales bacterium]|nr:hypothetical protein [Bdellovibrionales bacterium]